MTHKHVTDGGKVGGFNASHPLVIRAKLQRNWKGGETNRINRTYGISIYT